MYWLLLVIRPLIELYFDLPILFYFVLKKHYVLYKVCVLCWEFFFVSIRDVVCLYGYCSLFGCNISTFDLHLLLFCCYHEHWRYYFWILLKMIKRTRQFICIMLIGRNIFLLYTFISLYKKSLIFFGTSWGLGTMDIDPTVVIVNARNLIWN